MHERATAYLQALGRRLFQARVAIGLTVREAAQEIGIDHSMIVRYENAQASPPLDRLIALADLYNTSPTALLASTDAAVALIAAIDQANGQTLTNVEQALRQASEKAG